MTTRRDELSPTEIQELLQVRVDTAAHYFDNAIKLLSEGEDRKSAELLWGAAAQMVKALALVAGENIRSHGRIHDFVHDELAPTYPELMGLFREIEGLHSHFYDARLKHDELEVLSGKTRDFLEKLRGLLYSRIGPPPTVDEMTGQVTRSPDST